MLEQFVMHLVERFLGPTVEEIEVRGANGTIQQIPKRGRSRDHASLKKPCRRSRQSTVPDAKRRARPPRCSRTSGLLDWVLRDPRLVEYCASAVDQFEVAARLETFGLSARVVRTSFGFSDVFAAAAVVFESILIWTCGRKRSRDPRWATPRTSCAVRSTPYRRSSCRSSSSVFTSAPFGGCSRSVSTVRLGTTQAFTVLSWSLRDRKDHRSDAVLAASSIVFTAVASLVVSLVVRALLGGSATSVELAVALSVYIAASSILIFHAAERLLLLCLAPGFIGSVLSLDTISDKDATWWILASGVSWSPSRSDRWSPSPGKGPRSPRVPSARPVSSCCTASLRSAHLGRHWLCDPQHTVFGVRCNRGRSAPGDARTNGMAVAFAAQPYGTGLA